MLVLKKEDKASMKSAKTFRNKLYTVAKVKNGKGKILAGITVYLQSLATLS